MTSDEREDIKDLIAVNHAVIDQADAWLRDYRRAKATTTAKQRRWWRRWFR